MVSVLVAGVLAVLAYRMERHEAVLDDGGRETLAVVVGVSEGFFRRSQDFVMVRFEVDGRQYQSELTVSDHLDLQVGDEVRVMYNPDSPGHAKPVEGWSPTYEMVWFGAGFVLVVGVVDTVRRGVRTLRLLRTARQPSRTTTMRAESFAIEHWWQRTPRYWAALWPADADPLVDDVQVYVPIEELDRRRALSVNLATTVLGEPQPHGWVVILQGDRVVWPRGRARRDEPEGPLVDVRYRSRPATRP